MLRAWFAFDAIVCGLKKQRRAHARGRQIFADTLILSCVGPTALIRVYSGRVSSCIITTCRTRAAVFDLYTPHSMHAATVRRPPCTHACVKALYTAEMSHCLDAVSVMMAFGVAFTEK